MNPDTSPLTDTLRSLLAQAPSLSAAQLQAATGMSQPSISLGLRALGTQVCKLGAARSTRYALTQPILGLAAQQTLHGYDERGRVSEFGQLTLLHNGDVHVRSQAPAAEWLARQTLPWFAAGLRPQGFLGRQYAQLRPDFPSDTDAWNTAQVLYIAANHMNDPPGALQLGRLRNQPMQQTLSAHDTAQLAAEYDTLAAQTGKTLPAGSSAGGEQPKFTVRLQDSNPGDPATTVHAIVKYTPPRGTPFGERWHDLLHLEHLAGEVLRSHGIACAQTRVVHSTQRSYLESQRFDRVGRSGKRHVVAAAAVHDAFVAAPRQHWVASCEALVAQGLLPADDLRQVALIYLFGQYIANTDMHFGNLSFFVDDVHKPQFRITPVYDMLPMQWRPSVYAGDLDAQPVRPQLQPPGYVAEAALAREWAVDYWQRAGQSAHISTELRSVCQLNVQRLQTNFESL